MTMETALFAFVAGAAGGVCDEIDNDLMLVDDVIRAYYNIEGKGEKK
ncbi:MAG: hypothetical protein QM271_01840 [Bacillota bacterium]|nr:hypothetical protein [Bacillota bacterium]